jgi:hypothetical protein
LAEIAPQWEDDSLLAWITSAATTSKAYRRGRGTGLSGAGKSA